MAELPHIGKHCDVEMCNRLDFLPVKCDACRRSFCVNHFTYDKHECSQAYQKNVQVPVCPLCNKPVPTPKGLSPDVQVNDHIQKNCEIQKTRIFGNKCTSRNCRKKELIPITCPSCQQNFCLRHRHEKDHGCSGRPCESTRSTEAQMAADEKLARELSGAAMRPNEEMDRRLAQQLQGEYNRNPRRQTAGDKSSEIQ